MESAPKKKNVCMICIMMTMTMTMLMMMMFVDLYGTQLPQIDHKQKREVYKKAVVGNLLS